MIDPRQLVEFKRATNEDLIVAGLVESIVDLSSVKTILDVGAGTGLVSAAISRGLNSCEIVVVEESSVYRYPDDFVVHRKKWEDADLRAGFDLVLFSHVIGDFHLGQRASLIEKGIKLLNDGGIFVLVENGPSGDFDDFVSELFERHGNEFEINFDEVELVFNKFDLEYRTFDFMTYLQIGRDIQEATKNANLFFPKLFEQKDRRDVLPKIQKMALHGRFVIPVNQRMYVSGDNINNKMKVQQVKKSD